MTDPDLRTRSANLTSTPTAFALLAGLFLLAFVLGVAGTVDSVGSLPGDQGPLDYIRACATQAPYAVAAVLCWLGAALRRPS